MCFDSNRQALLAAYNQHVTFSLSLNMSNSVAHRMFRFEETLIRENRNLKRIVGQEEHHHEKRLRLLQIGPINALSILLKLPPTEHDPNSFKLDNCFFSVRIVRWQKNTDTFIRICPTLNAHFQLFLILLATHDIIQSHGRFQRGQADGQSSTLAQLLARIRLHTGPE